MLLWVDLETTGLCAEEDKILELAAIVTDDKLVEVARMQAVTNSAQFVPYTTLDQVVRDMHYQNGLWMDSLRSTLPVNNRAQAKDGVTLQTLFEKFIRDYALTQDDAGKEVKPQLAGSTISFDRAFMEYYLSDAAKLFHYRNLDVTSFNELARRVAPALHEGRPRQTGTAHRAMADIESSLTVARYYAANLPPAPAPAVLTECPSNPSATSSP